MKEPTVLVLSVVSAVLGLSGCTSPSSDVAVGARIVPLAVADRSKIDGHFELRGIGVEAVIADIGALKPVSCQASIRYMPLESTADEGDADLVVLDLGVHVFDRSLANADDEIVFYFTYGAGVSAMYLDMDRHHDMGGGGAFGRGGVGVIVGDRAYAELFADVHGWAGADADESRGMCSFGLGISVLFRF